MRSRPTSTPSRLTITPAPSDDAGEPPEAAGGTPRFSWGGRMRRVRRDSRMTFSPGGPNVQIGVGIRRDPILPTRIMFDTPAGRESPQILLLDDEVDPGSVVLTCANCGAPMDERKCKLICRC